MPLMIDNTIQPGTILKAQKTLTAAATSCEITGLNLDSDIRYLIQGRILYDAGAGNGKIFIYTSGDETATHYYTQIMRAAAGVLDGARGNTSGLANETTFGAGDAAMFEGILARNGDGYPVMNLSVIYGAPSGINTLHNYWVWNDNTTNLTTLKLLGNVASNLAAGTYLRAYKLV